MENWWCDFSNSYFDMFTGYIWHIVFADVRCACGKDIYIKHIIHAYALDIPNSIFFVVIIMKLFLCRLFFVIIYYVLDSLFHSFCCPKICLREYKIILLHFLVVFSCYSVFITFFHQHSHIIVVGMNAFFFYSIHFFRYSMWFSTPTTLNACLLLKFWMEFSKTSKLRENYVFSTVWNAEMTVSYAAICIT